MTAPLGGVEHQLDAATRLCTETCTHPAHDGPVVVAIPASVKPLLDEWLSHLDLVTTFAPSPVDTFDGLRCYAVVVDPAHPLFAEGPLAGRLRAGAGPRTGQVRR